MSEDLEVGEEASNADAIYKAAKDTYEKSVDAEKTAYSAYARAYNEKLKHRKWKPRTEEERKEILRWGKHV